MKVLLIEDNPEIVRTVSLCFQLRWQGASIISAPEGTRGLHLVQNESPDIVILDLGLPCMDGFEVLKQIRLFSSVPVIILTVREDELDKVRGLEEGADDYITKPFSPLDLLARVKAVMRRSRVPEVKDESSPPLVAGPLTINYASREVSLNNDSIHLTPNEFDLLSYMTRNEGKVLSHQSLLNAVWGSEFIDVSTLKKYIYQLRVKLGDTTEPPKMILSERGVGYKFVKPTSGADIPSEPTTPTTSG
ncbi:MAG: response regulator transcription factor [Chloroflexota bacterium]